MTLEEIIDKLKDGPSTEEILTMDAIAEKYGAKIFVGIARAIITSRFLDTEDSRQYNELVAIFTGDSYGHCANH